MKFTYNKVRTAGRSSSTNRVNLELRRGASRLGRVVTGVGAIVASSVAITGIANVGGGTAYAQPIIDCKGPEVAMATGTTIDMINISTAAKRTIIANTSTGTAPEVPGMASTNQIGVIDGGAKVIFTAEVNGTKVIEYDLATDTYEETASNRRGVAGAVNPKDGKFYFGSIAQPNPSYDAYDPATNTITENVFTLTLPEAPGTNGDIAFDRDGNLYALSSDGGGVLALYRATGPVPAAGQTEVAAVKLSNGQSSGQVNGIAFGSDGYLYTSSTQKLTKFNPTTGALISEQDTFGTDLGSCVDPDRIRVYKSFPNGRVADGDQVNLSIAGGGLTLGTSAQTTGTEVGVQDQSTTEYIGPLVVVAPNTFQISETPVGSTDLAGYKVTWQCVDTTTSTTIASGEGAAGEFTIEQPAELNIVCTFTNVPKGVLTVQKELPDGRVAPGDQFVLSSAPGGPSVTTTGEATGVQAEKSVLTDAVPGTSYTITEAASGTTNLDYYGSVWTCVDTANNNAEVAKGTGSSGTLTMPGPTGTTPANVVCTFSNAAKAPSLEVAKSVDPASGTEVEAGQELTYTLTFANKGEAPAAVDYVDDISGVLDDAVVTEEPKVATGEGLTVSEINGGNFSITGTLAPGATSTVTYKVTVDSDGSRADDLLLNFVIKPGTKPPAKCETTNPLCTENPVKQNPQIALTKRIDSIQDADSSNSNSPGDVVSYGFVVTNTGNTVLNDIVLNDPKLSDEPLQCPKSTLQPGEEMVCGGETYVLTAADATAGSFDNVATVTGTDPSGKKVTDDSSATVTPIVVPIRPPLPKSGSSMAVTLAGAGAGMLAVGTILLLAIRRRQLV